MGGVPISRGCGYCERVRAGDATGSQGGRETAVVGLQWGDEGKGKLVDLLTPGHDMVVRYNGGANAGHSVVVGGEKFALHLLPSGILSPEQTPVIASGVVVDPVKLIEELDSLDARGVDTGRLVVSTRAHMVMPYHKAEDELREQLLAEGRDGGAGAAGGEPIGTTRRGIGPCYADKAHRATALRMGDLLEPAGLERRVRRICGFKLAMFRGLCAGTGVDFDPADCDPERVLAICRGAANRLGGCLEDTTALLHAARAGGRGILFEGANATLLDVDHGMYPFVTSSATSALGIPQGTGLPMSAGTSVVGVVKAYSSRVGNGPFPTELDGALGERIRERGREYGTTTGRPRRVGWLDLVALRYTAMINGATSIALTLLDVLSDLDELRVCVGYEQGGRRVERFPAGSEEFAGVSVVYETLPGFTEDISWATGYSELPSAARAYVEFISGFVGVPVSHVSVGPDRAQTIVR